MPLNPNLPNMNLKIWHCSLALTMQDLTMLSSLSKEIGLSIWNLRGNSFPLAQEMFFSRFTAKRTANLFSGVMNKQNYVNEIKNVFNKFKIEYGN